MKLRYMLLSIVALQGAVLPSFTCAQPTAFTYQGQLIDNGGPASGVYDLQFTIYDDPIGSGIVGGPVTNSAVVVTNGLFMVMLDFGAGVFGGADLWLGTGVRTNGGGAFTGLTPLQPITSTPYATLAAGVPNASITSSKLSAGAVTTAVLADSAVSGVKLAGDSVTGSHVADSSIGAADVDVETFSTTFWKTDGNAGTTAGTHFLGTTDSQSLELKANNLRGLRIENTGDSSADIDSNADGAPNLIGGSPVNFVPAGVVGAVIGGGGAMDHDGSAFTNSISADFGFVGGGIINRINAGASASIVAGGVGNRVGTDSAYGVIPGGYVNIISNNSTTATISGGTFNDIGANAGNSAIGGGWENDIADNSPAATIAGGRFNDIGSSAANGAIAGGEDNNIGDGTISASISGGLRNDIYSGGHYAVIGGGERNRISPSHATIGGGCFNEIDISSIYSTIGGGWSNRIAVNSFYCTIAGGWQNDIEANADVCSIGGGQDNNIGDSYAATISGGWFNEIGSNSAYSAIGGGADNDIGPESWFVAIPGGVQNIVGADADSSTIAGGGDNEIGDDAKYSCISGGRENAIGAGASYAFAAGRRAKANHSGTFVWADGTDVDFASASTNQFLIRASDGMGIGTASPQGLVDLQSGDSDTGALFVRASPSVGDRGGIIHHQSSTYAWQELAQGTGTTNGGSLVYNYVNRTAPGTKVAEDILVLQADGDVGIGTSTPLHPLHVIGDIFATGTITPNSDRNAKTDIHTVDPCDVLARVNDLPIRSWRFKAEDEGVKHIGPMAQDFHAAFGLGAEQTAIATVDADGVALAAIQGLSQKLGQKEKKILELEQRLAKLEQLLIQR